MTSSPTRIRNNCIKIKMPKLENGSLLRETASVVFLVYLPDTRRKMALGRALSVKLIKNRFMIIKIGHSFAFGNFPL